MILFLLHCKCTQNGQGFIEQQNQGGAVGVPYMFVKSHETQNLAKMLAHILQEMPAKLCIPSHGSGR